MGVVEQAQGTVDNVTDLYADIEAADLIPPSILSTLVFVRDSLPKALGFTDEAAQHIANVVVFSVVLVVASLTTLTVVAVVFFAIAMPVAVARLVPAVNDLWPVRSGDWPFWEVQD